MAPFYRDPRLAGLLAGLRWRVRPEHYALVGLDAREQIVALRLLAGLRATFWQVTVEPEMITLLVEERDWRDLAPAFTRPRVQRPMRIISFDIDLPPDLVGFMAMLTDAIAAMGVSLLAVCSFNQDHLVVREQDLDAVGAALDRLVTDASE
ncbi:MAG TPA: ACT domain-containing protein [Roseiflexaceae bacterium]|nr:ACT domain-containing protein [Roseiflexaceae bacterium]HMP41085.1 ACT domain-containing protein [Roseiflexaceae bacterium]